MQCSPRCLWYRRRCGGRAAATAACLGLLVVAWSAPTPAVPLLYVNTGRFLEVIDADTGRLRKKILPPPSDSFGFGQGVAAGGRLYVAGGPTFPSYLVVDPDRNVAERAVPDLPFIGLLRAAADGAALYGLLNIDTDPDGVFFFPLGRLDLVQGVLSTIRTSAFEVRGGCVSEDEECRLPEPPPECRLVCSDMPSCRCFEPVDFIVPPGGRTIHVLRASTVGTFPLSPNFLEPAPPARQTLDLVAIDSSSGTVLRTSRVLELPPSRQSLSSEPGGRPSALALLPDGERALVQVGERKRRREGLTVGTPPQSQFHRVGGRTTLISVALASGHVEKRVTLNGVLPPIAVAADQGRLYAMATSSPTVLVLDARPASLFQQIATISLGGRRPRLNGNSLLAISPRGDRIAVMLERGRQLSLVIVDTEHTRAVAEVHVTRPESFALGNLGLHLGSLVPGLTDTPFPYTLLDGCSNTEPCFCTVDGDCDDRDPCNTSSCQGREGCINERRPCFDGALCLFGKASVLTAFPGVRRFESLETRIRDALKTGFALPPGTPPGRYRRTLARAEALVAKLIAAELKLLSSHGGSAGSDEGETLGTQFETLILLREARRSPATCAARGG